MLLALTMVGFAGSVGETMVERRRFTVDDYYQMAEAGIMFTSSDRLSRGDTVAPRLLPSWIVPVDVFLIE